MLIEKYIEAIEGKEGCRLRFKLDGMGVEKIGNTFREKSKTLRCS